MPHVHYPGGEDRPAYPQRHPNRPDSSRPSPEEERAWSQVYRRVSAQSGFARKVLKQLDADAELKRRHFALYLRCEDTLATAAARQQRAQRVASLVRIVLRSVFVAPWVKLTSILRVGRDVALELMLAREPASKQVRALVQADVSIARQRADFERRGASTSGQAPAKARQSGNAEPMPLEAALAMPGIGDDDLASAALKSPSAAAHRAAESARGAKQA